MIFESAYWKDDLLRRSSLLRRYMTQKRWSGASFAKLEQTVMIGFYSIRKLVEATKLTNALSGASVSIYCYPSKGKAVTRLNRTKVDELYDLDAPRKQNLALVDLCHQFVHSYIFTPVLDESGGLSAIWIASDRQRSRALLGVEAKTVIGIFETVGNDKVRSMRATFDASLADYRIENHS
jgi:hypothetical protein